MFMELVNCSGDEFSMKAFRARKLSRRKLRGGARLSRTDDLVDSVEKAFLGLVFPAREFVELLNRAVLMTEGLANLPEFDSTEAR